MAVAISTSSLISSAWQATLQHYNNRFFLKDYPFPCHSSNPICNSFNFKRRPFSSSKFNDHVFVNPSSSSSYTSKLSPFPTHSSFAGNPLQSFFIFLWISSNFEVSFLLIVLSLVQSLFFWFIKI